MKWYNWLEIFAGLLLFAAATQTVQIKGYEVYSVVFSFIAGTMMVQTMTRNIL